MISFEIFKEKVEAIGYLGKITNNGSNYVVKCGSSEVIYYSEFDTWIDEKKVQNTNFNKMLNYLNSNKHRQARELA